MVHKDNVMIAISSPNFIYNLHAAINCKHTRESKTYPVKRFYPGKKVERQ